MMEKAERPRISLPAPPAAEIDIAGTQVALLFDGEQCFPAMLQGIASATKSIRLEMYWFASDVWGRRFANALIERAHAGVSVRVIYDAIGSISADAEMFETMRVAGCEVQEYHPIAPWRSRFRLGKINNRDHRKILVIDDELGFTGGVNIGDEWAPAEDGGGDFQDDMIRLRGPAALGLAEVFERTWRHCCGASRKGEPGGRDQNPHVTVLANGFFLERRSIAAEYRTRIDGAKRSISIINPYFIPQRSLRKALGAAARRGVDVHVIVPGESDVVAVQYASRRVYDGLLSAGVKISELHGRVLHAKTALIDDEWTVVGTYNLDWRSFRLNLEVAVAVVNTAIGSAMRERFTSSLRSTRAVTLSDHRYRSLGDRFLEHFFYLFRRWL